MSTEKEVVKGYKVFNSDWTCRGKVYTCPGRFQEKEHDLRLCEYGMHFCLNIADCFNYYDFDPNNHVAEIVAYGEVIKGDDKCCTDDIEIVRVISWNEVLQMCNTGDWNTGNRNTGDWNTGNCNTGNCNTGDRNTGDWNTGNCNTGDWNTGDWNTGNCNTGDWNTGNCNTGCFNTEKHNIFLFNQYSDWSYSDWLHSKARRLLNNIQKDVVEWICTNDMTEAEKKKHPEYETTGGYLKVLDESECNQIWWDGLTEDQKEIIRNIPNYDKKIFEEITGIVTD